ncbi:MAG: ABC transporter ATP-binding protein [Ruminococcus sp.]|nr:ABC transporter ATP-binding protein [Ruminococcus sp.]
MIQLKNISKVYGKKHKTIALKEINLHIERGKMTAVMGRSGCGKSTLINIIGGLTLSTTGEYYFENKLLKNTNKAMCDFRNKNIGFIVQNYALINNKTAFENIAIALNTPNEKKVMEIAKELGITNILNKLPSEMSGGECQRTAIARAIINSPKLILADEPTGALDSENGKIVMDILRNIVNNDTTAIIVTHDLQVANLCDTIIHMNDGTIV